MADLNTNRIPVYDYYIDSSGNRVSRASGQDSLSLKKRTVDAIWDLAGYDRDKELRDKIALAIGTYERGKYSESLEHFHWSVKRLPTLFPHVFYYMKVCQRILKIPLTSEDIDYERELQKYENSSKFVKMFLTVPGLKIRCKWCGRYTNFIHPDVSTMGFAFTANSCSYCIHTYPMPSFIWDSPNGRAYSYYRKSFTRGNKKFYKDFEEDYDPIPQN